MATVMKTWIAPTLVGVLAFAVVRPGLAQIAERDQQLRNQLAGAQTNVGDEVVAGYQQVYYLVDGKRVFVTDGKQNSRDAVIDGENIAWVREVNGLGQIVLYNIVTDTATQITQSGNNLQPRISGNRIVWERWVDGSWQVFLYDGIRIRQLTSGDVSIHPDISGNEVVYARKNADGAWRSVRYSLTDGSTEDVAVGLRAKFPRFRGRDIVFAADSTQLKPEAAAAEPSTSPIPTHAEIVPSESPALSPSRTPDASPSVSPLVSPSPISTASLLPSVSPTPLSEVPQQVTEADIIQELKEVSPSGSPSPTPSASPNPDAASASPEPPPEDSADSNTL